MSNLKLTLKALGMNTVEIANSLDLDEVAHNEPPHLDLQCLHSSLEFSISYSLYQTFFFLSLWDLSDHSLHLRYSANNYWHKV